MPLEKATFAAGCFWGVEARFRKVTGVIDVTAGYTGGHSKNPTYHDVCQHDTGHAEAVEISFDPAQASYLDLLTVFWLSHDPTSLHRQGADIGDQYRSAVFYHDEYQRELAERSKQEQKTARPIVTEITQAGVFYPAEEYHQRYLEKRGGT